MKLQSKERVSELSEGCIRSLVNKNAELERLINSQEIRIAQLEEALAELYNELDVSEFQNAEKSGIIIKVTNLLSKSNIKHTF